MLTIALAVGCSEDPGAFELGGGGDGDGDGASGGGRGSNGEGNGDGDGDGDSGDGDGFRPIVDPPGDVTCTDLQYESLPPTATQSRECSELSDCPAGTFVVTDPTSTVDRLCDFCAQGSYSTAANLEACELWTPCGGTDVEVVAGTSRSDRKCGADTGGDGDGDGDAGPTWIEQFGSTGDEYAYGVTTDDQRDVFVAGYTTGDLAGSGSNQGDRDIFVTKLAGTNGSELWARQLGTTGPERGLSVSVDGDGNVLVVGNTQGSLFETGAGGDDAFVVKLSGNDGSTIWARQFGTTGGDMATSVAVNADGDVLVVGFTPGDLFGDGYNGGFDTFAMKLDGSDGTTVWTRQFGTGGLDYGYSVSLDANGDLYIAGETTGNLGGGGNAGDSDAYVRKLLGSDGTTVWTQQFGTAARDVAWSVVVDGSNAIVAGYTSGALFDTWAGSTDIFVTKIASADGAFVWDQQYGSGNADFAWSLDVNAAGDVFVGGGTEGDFAGNSGGRDVLVMKLDGTDGVAIWSWQAGTNGSDYARSLCVDTAGSVLVTGRTNGNLSGGGNLGGFDALIIKLDLSL